MGMSVGRKRSSYNHSKWARVRKVEESTQGRGDGAVEVFAGGPFAQADFDGSWVDVFGAEAVEDLLILSPE